MRRALFALTSDHAPNAVPAWLAAALLLSLAAGCGRGRQRASHPTRLPVHVLADTARSERLHVEPPRARVWLARVSATKPPAIEPGLPEPAPDSLIPEPEPIGLAIDEDLKPPILRTPGLLRLPTASRPRGTRTQWVDVDVRVDEAGAVSDAIEVEGSDDTTLVRAAIECALSMRFYPALQAGRPVAVWCRQRFEFGGRR